MEELKIPYINEPNSKMKSLNEFSKKEKVNKEYKIKLEIIDKSIRIIIKEGINSFNGQFNLNDLKVKDKYFEKFETIEEAYKEIFVSFNENKYDLKNEETNLILNIEINNKKNIIPFILEKSEVKKDDLIKSLYIIANNNAKENKELKEIIKILFDKVNKMEEKFNSFENKIDTIFDYTNEKKEKEKEISVNFESILRQSKIVEKEQISILKDWLPFDKNKIKCKLIYDAKRDGDKASIFHSLCDNKESTLTIISTSDNKKIGGFLSKPFGGNKRYISDNNAFVFSLNYKEKYPSLNKGKNYEDIDNMGPIFGSTCISINDNFLSSDKNYYHPYNSRYNFGKRESINDFFFTVNDLEIYQIFE